MSVLLCCGPCFDPQYLTEEGLIYPWIDSLLISMNEKVNNLNFSWLHLSFEHCKLSKNVYNQVLMDGYFHTMALYLIFSF